MVKNLKQRKLPATREAITHEFKVAGVKGYLTIGLFEDGTPGEIFINVSKEGSTISGLFDTISIAVSFALQYGVPLDKFVEKFSYMKFEPSGFTGTDFGYAHSIVDYCFRWTGQYFGKKKPEDVHHLDDEIPPDKEEGLSKPMFPELKTLTDIVTIDSPPCKHCGGITKRNGSCHVCLSCGETSGCS